MFRTRRLGVEEGNAIDTIMAYETKVRQGIATTEERLAYEAARRVLGVGSVPKAAAPSPVQGNTEEGDTLSRFNHLVNHLSLKGYDGAFTVIGVVFALFGASLLLLLMYTWVLNSLVSLAHP